MLSLSSRKRREKKNGSTQSNLGPLTLRGNSIYTYHSEGVTLQGPGDNPEHGLKTIHLLLDCQRQIACEHQGKRDVERRIGKSMHQENAKSMKGKPEVLKRAKSATWEYNKSHSKK